MFLLLLDRHSGTPVYRQIVDQVRFQVASGVLPAGTELPSTRALAAEHGVNPMTVSKAYAELEREAVLERRPGRPHVVAAQSEPSTSAQREGELTRLLEPAVQATHQLGVAPEEATDLFRRLLERPVPAAPEGDAPDHADEGDPATRGSR